MMIWTTKEKAEKAAAMIKEAVVDYPWEQVGGKCWLKELWILRDDISGYSVLLAYNHETEVVPNSPHFNRIIGSDFIIDEETSLFIYSNEGDGSWKPWGHYSGSYLVWRG